MPLSQCDDGADLLIAHLFNDCIYNARDYAGFVCGLASILTWMVAQFPQIAHNVKNKSAEALSVWFLAEWLLGDTCNLIGCLLTGDQLITQTYTAMYFICTDIVLVMQYIYYGTLLRRQQRSFRNQQRMRRLTNRALEEDPRFESDPSRYPLISQLGQTPKPRIFACFMLLFVFGEVVPFGRQHMALSSSHLGSGRHLLTASSAFLSERREWTRAVGQSIGWVSSLFYLGSRLAQIYKNWARQSADGLSLAMFGCAIAANVLYGAGILFRTYAWKDLSSSAPWLLGSLGTVFLDLIIFSQFSRYHDKALPEQAPLVEEAASD